MKRSSRPASQHPSGPPLAIASRISNFLLPPDVRAGSAADVEFTRLRRRRVVFAWVVVLSWAAVIWQLGGDDFSAQETGSFLAKWFHALFAELDLRTRYRILMGIRKSAHFVEYGILGLFAFRAAWISAGRNQVAMAACTALAFVAILATADEARQTFSLVRTGSGWDVLLDITGGCVAILAVVLIARRVRGFAAASPTADAPQSG